MEVDVEEINGAGAGAPEMGGAGGGDDAANVEEALGDDGGGGGGGGDGLGFPVWLTASQRAFCAQLVAAPAQLNQCCDPRQLCLGLNTSRQRRTRIIMPLCTVNFITK